MSPLTTKMDFLTPANLPPIATFRIMNSDGVKEGQNQRLSDVTDKQVLGWYRKMLTGGCCYLYS